MWPDEGGGGGVTVLQATPRPLFNSQTPNSAEDAGYFFPPQPARYVHVERVRVTDPLISEGGPQPLGAP